jgi:SAM-dependent methyltransferase
VDSAYARTARYYDKLYAFKDYAAESESLLDVIRNRIGSPRPSILDVACGTGLHIAHLKRHASVQGLDISPDLIDIARNRNPDVRFHQGDMAAFDLGETFDVVACLFSSIGYVETIERLEAAMRCMTRHVRSGGLLLIEPWFTPADWTPHTVHALFIDEPALKIARVSTSFVEGRLSIFDLHHLIGTPEGTEHIVEHHSMGLFEREEMARAMGNAGLEVAYDPAGPSGRGLYIGTKP